MYHINHEGKVYPCRAKIRSCPYGAEWHAETKEELYYKSMRFNPEIKVSDMVKQEINDTGRLRSLYPLSSTIEKVPYPIESLVTNLEYAIKRIEEIDPQKIKKDWNDFVNNSAELYSDVLLYKLRATEHLPEEVELKGIQIFNERHKGRHIEFGAATGNRIGFNNVSKVNDLKDDFLKFEEYKKFGLTESNKENTLGWLKEDFYQFSHDLNTSKMLTRPIFYGNIKQAKEKIKELDDYELLGTYDDYLVSDEEIMENVRLAKNFHFKPRPDLSREANINIKHWYDRNKVIVEHWVENSPKRILLSMEMANELDRRGICRQ